MARPWDQLKGEPDAAYARFWAYLSLGPARSLRAAYGAYTGTTEGYKKLHLPGQWVSDSRTYRWVERAHAWDVAQFRKCGRRAIIAYVHLVGRTVEKALEHVEEAEGPRSWKDFIQTLVALSALIPQEAVAALLGSGRR